MHIEFKKGFTLLEVLISVLIIGILASITIVNNYDASRKQAKMADLKTKWAITEGKYVELLTGKWLLDEGSGIVIKDSSTFLKDGTLFGTVDANTWKLSNDCVSGSCLSFNGSNNYITFPTISILNNISASAWAYYSNPNQNGFIIGKNPVNTQWELFLQAGFVLWRGGGSASVSCAVPAINTWHYFVAVQRGTAASLYIDGVLCASNTVVDIGNGNGTVEIGRFNTASYYYYNGLLDEVAVYSDAITVSEIKSNYLAGLDSLLVKDLITKEEYNHRVAELDNKLAENK